MSKSGVLNVNKPEGMTSHDVVARLRKRLGMKRVGHTGTLDPMATGVLPICFGNATRIIEYYDGDMKTYEAGMKLGVTTDTFDTTGEVVSEMPFDRVTEEMIVGVLSSFRGETMQVPPKYSALKVNGKPLYKYARAGIDVDVEAKKRKVYIPEIEATTIDLGSGTVDFRVTCSKGTYIRSICADAGEKLGCGACMSSLVRTASGFFRIEDSYGLEEIEAMSDDELYAAAAAPDETLPMLGIAEVRDKGEFFFINGRTLTGSSFTAVRECEAKSGNAAGMYRVYGEKGFLGIGKIEDGCLRPCKVMAERR
jgi:tRNA pseudouridine55 synthase